MVVFFPFCPSFGCWVPPLSGNIKRLAVKVAAFFCDWLGQFRMSRHTPGTLLCTTPRAGSEPFMASSGLYVSEHACPSKPVSWWVGGGRVGSGRFICVGQPHTLGRAQSHKVVAGVVNIACLLLHKHFLEDCWYKNGPQADGRAIQTRYLRRLSLSTERLSTGWSQVAGDSQ